MTPIESVIVEFITTSLLYNAKIKVNTPDDPILGRGLLDSLGVLRLVTFLEQEFEISIPDADIVPDNFETVKVVAKLVEARRAANGEVNHGGDHGHA